MQPGPFCRALEEKLTGRTVKIQNESDYFAAAVVVPLLEQHGEPALLYEVRAAQLAWQPGEICFPGGRIEPGDADPQQAAVRETCEELGLVPGGLRLLGPLDYLVSPIGVIIHPFAAFLADPAALKPNAGEVAEAFTVPLKFFLENAPLVAEMEVATRPLPGFPTGLVAAGYPKDWRRRSKHPVLFYRYGRHVIWGLTARITHSFVELCRTI
jgi:8-oxo-dGTP pyrophosphatase MutT (NUDIX family)